MICPRCGNQINDNSRYCNFCHYDFHSPENTIVDVDAVEKTNNKSTKNNKSYSKLFLSYCILFCSIAVIAFSFVFTEYKLYLLLIGALMLIIYFLGFTRIFKKK
jgi:uncharacterized membrane protein YvbJ